MVMFVYMNAVNYDALQPLNAHAQHKKQPSIQRKRFWIRTNMR